MTDPLEQAQVLQNMLVAKATGSVCDNSEYVQLRKAILSKASLKARAPEFVRTCRSLAEFWGYIKARHGTYQARREHIWSEFRPLLEALEGQPSPSDSSVAAMLQILDPAHVHSVWTKALERRDSDPEGAITSARTLLEAVCKHVLDEMVIEYGEADDLPALYKKTSLALKLAPSQYTEAIFKQILGGCTAVVEGLGAIRNRLSDSHGKGIKASRPSGRHAELAVNLAGAAATFIVQTWLERKDSDRSSHS
jgi:hypothetical protein